ncbi:MAG TPA: RDD family protein [Stellaceae bacterium]|nr:RDD family protein [Stellaceae bacterium]
MTAAHELASTFLEGGGRNRRELMTPEGVPLAVDLADYGERAVAFVIDFVLCMAATILIYLLVIFLPFGGTTGIVARSLVLFIAFVVRNFYFIHFELAWQGATPGKRIVGLRVVDRRGGPLLPAAVVARNLTREIEAFMPIGLLQSPVGAGSAAWEQLSLGLWLLLFALLPFVNRDRMRAGDLIAGTMVVALPRRVLLGDLVESAAHYSFTEKQLQAYGAFELQVLEELLRRPDGVDTSRLLREVADKICRRVEYTALIPDPDIRVFLREFYTAERAFLEREQLFGKPRADKYYESKSPPEKGKTGE